jgi:pyruvate,water dikinase
LDAERLGVVSMYLFGSTRNATAGPASDIDLLIHFRGSEDQLSQLHCWLDGWSQCLSEGNYIRTGLHSDGLLDVEVITDADIANRTGWAARLHVDSLKQLTLVRQRRPS